MALGQVRPQNPKKRFQRRRARRLNRRADLAKLVLGRFDPLLG